MNNEEKTKKKSGLRNMSEQTKWIITGVLFVLAILTVIMCARSGNFTFKHGSVQAHDAPVVETKAPEDNEDKGDATVKHTVLVTAGNGGSVDPNGSVSVEDWGSLTVNITPSKGYEIQSVKIDGEDKGAVSSYTLSYIKEDHTIIATFQKKPEPTPTPTPEDDIDDIVAGLSDLLGG